MKRLSMVIVGLCVAATVPSLAQGAGELSPSGPRPPAGDRPAPDTTPLTAAQQAQVKAILSKYQAATLTADQAKAIHEAFRQAGLRGGPAMDDTLRAAGFSPEKLRELHPPRDQQRGSKDDQRPADDAGTPSERPQNAEPADQAKHGQGQYTLEQAISDRAQLNTIAFSGLAFITGDFGASTFMPPGKVCDFFGFQYMRDIDAAGKGHNPVFLNRVAGNVLHILNDEQRKLFADLAAEQATQFEQLAFKRLPLIQAFHRQLDGAIPAGSSGLNREAVIRYVGDFYEFDAALSYRRAEVFGQVVASLTAEQKAAFAQMKFGDFNTWPDLDERDALKRPNPGASKFFTVAYMTYASEFFSWYAGSVEADTYFCPERHGTYFGGFYMKDMPAMGKRNYDISTSRTGDSGEALLELLNPDQRSRITSIIEKQRKPLAEMVTVRRAISTELRKFLAGGQPDKQKVLALGRRYGELDGEASWMYAMAFAGVGKTLTPAQRAECVKLRNLDGYQSAPAYLYSQPLQKMPDVTNSDFLFAAPSPQAPQHTPGPATVSASKPSDTPATPATAGASFTLQSPAVADGEPLPAEYTGDGESSTLPLEWKGAPEGTQCFAVMMHHVDREGKTKSYWILYNIPANTRSLSKNTRDVGVLGANSLNGKAEYAPPHSKGPGTKTYVYTVYALSDAVQIAGEPSAVNRDTLLAAMKDHILASAELKVVYTRPAGTTSPEEPPAQPPHDPGA